MVPSRRRNLNTTARAGELPSFLSLFLTLSFLKRRSKRVGGDGDNTERCSILSNDNATVARRLSGRLVSFQPRLARSSEKKKRGRSDVTREFRRSTRSRRKADYGDQRFERTGWSTSGAIPTRGGIKSER